MENEKRLIDANALCEKIGNMKSEITHTRGGYMYCNEAEKNEWDKLDSFDSLVCDTPTVDAVEVVRCKVCVYGKLDNAAYYHDIYGNENDTTVFHCLRGLGYNKGEHFCSYGERKDNG